MLLKQSNNKQGEPHDVAFLDNLKEDLRVLEKSWHNKNLKLKRVIRHFEEILDSLSEIARVEAIEAAGVICDSLKDHLASVAGGKAELGEQAWATTVELIDLLADSLRKGNVPYAGFENLKTRWKQGADGPEQPSLAVPNETGRLTKRPGTASDGTQAHNLEENEMSSNDGIDPNELLKKAQEALLSGQDDSAKELALKAAELISTGAAEERRQKELTLRTDLENIINEESEAEQSMTHINEKIAEREEALNEVTERLSQAHAALDERENACRQVREQIDKVEAQMAEIKQKHKELLDSFQEVLPARDAAERECTKIKAQYGELPVEIESLRDRLQDMEHRLEQIRKRKVTTEAELEKFGVKTATA